MRASSTATTPAKYIAEVNEKQRADIKKLDALIRKTVPKLKPYMSYGMIGYGKFHYKNRSGGEGDWPLIALAAQKHYISLYVCAADGHKYLAEQYKKELPKASIGRSCIRFKKLEDVDVKVITEILRTAQKWGGMNAQK